MLFTLALTTMFVANREIGRDIVCLPHDVFPSSDVVEMTLAVTSRGDSPTMATVTPALWLARFDHLNDVWAKRILAARFKNLRPQDRNDATLADRVGANECRFGCGVLRVVCGLHEPAAYIVDLLREIL